MDTTYSKKKRTVDLGGVDLKATLIRMTNRAILDLIEDDPYIDISISHELCHFSERSVAQRVGVEVEDVKPWLIDSEVDGVKKYKKGKVVYVFLSDLDTRLKKRQVNQ